VMHVVFTALVVLAGVGAFATIIWLAGERGREQERRNQQLEAQRRLRDAIEADARGRERIARGELLSDDGHRRD